MQKRIENNLCVVWMNYRLYVYIYIYIVFFMNKFMYSCVYLRMYAFVCVHVHIYMHAYILTHDEVSFLIMQTRIYIIHTYTHTHTHTHIQTHIYMYNKRRPFSKIMSVLQNQKLRRANKITHRRRTPNWYVVHMKYLWRWLWNKEFKNRYGKLENGVGQNSEVKQMHFINWQDYAMLVRPDILAMLRLRLCTARRLSMSSCEETGKMAHRAIVEKKIAPNRLSPWGSTLCTAARQNGQIHMKPPDEGHTKATKAEKDAKSDIPLEYKLERLLQSKRWKLITGFRQGSEVTNWVSCEQNRHKTVWPAFWAFFEMNVFDRKWTPRFGMPGHEYTLLWLKFIWILFR